jgi:hypothetical protein
LNKNDRSRFLTNKSKTSEKPHEQDSQRRREKANSKFREATVPLICRIISKILELTYFVLGLLVRELPEGQMRSLQDVPAPLPAPKARNVLENGQKPRAFDVGLAGALDVQKQLSSQR